MMKIRKLFLFMTLISLCACSRIPGLKALSSGQTVTPPVEQLTVTVSAQLPTFTPAVTPSPTIETTQGTLTIWHSLGEEQIKVLDQILKDFSDQYPDVLFDVLYIPQENLLQRYQIATQEGNAPDLLFGLPEWGPVLYDAGSIADLSKLVDQQILKSINPPALETDNYKSALVGLPYAQQGVVLYRNKALLNHSPATFDELVNLSKSITQGEIIGADLEQGLFYSGGHLQGLGGKLINEDGTPAFNDENGKAWLELLKSFELAGPTEYASDRDLDLFKEGRVGWIIDGTWNLADLSQALGLENLAVDPWPTNKGSSLAGYVQPFNLYLNSQTEGDDLKAAQKFLNFFLLPTSQSRLLDAGLIPTISGVAITDPRQEILMTQVLTALAGGVPYPTNPAFPVYIAPLDAAIQSFLSGKTSADEALSNAEKIIQAQLAQITPTVSATTSP